VFAAVNAAPHARTHKPKLEALADLVSVIDEPEVMVDKSPPKVTQRDREGFQSFIAAQEKKGANDKAKSATDDSAPTEETTKKMKKNQQLGQTWELANYC
jgi:hypothetical protein